MFLRNCRPVAAVWQGRRRGRSVILIRPLSILHKTLTEVLASKKQKRQFVPESGRSNRALQTSLSPCPVYRSYLVQYERISLQDSVRRDSTNAIIGRLERFGHDVPQSSLKIFKYSTKNNIPASCNGEVINLNVQ